MKEIELQKQLPVIKMNFEEVKNSLETTMSKYKEIVVTEEGLKDCKATQRNLAGLRNKIDYYRKTVKKEMEVPIKKFEGQCKELITLISNAEKPIKEGISVYDNKRKEEKKEKSLELIKEIIQSYSLNNKYASMLTVKDEYLNLSKSIKSIKEDIEMRAKILSGQQKEEEDKKEMLRVSIQNSVDNANKNINTKLNYSDFTKYIEMNWPLDRVLKEINERAEIIALAEKSKEEIEPINEEIKEEVKIPIDLKTNTEELKEKKKYFVDVYVEHNFEKIQALSKYLKDNGYTYKVHNKGRIKEEI